MRLLLPTLAAAAALLPAAPAAASCVAMDPDAQRARADVIVEGRIVAAGDGRATLAVTRRIKGAAPAELRVRGAGGPGVVSSVDIAPRPGERWRILGRSTGPGAVTTSICDGSRRLGAVAPPPAERLPTGLAALLAWLLTLF